MRTFLGVPLPASLPEKFPSLFSLLKNPALKRVAPETYHLTLFFFGEKKEEEIKRIKEKINGSLDAFYPMRLSQPRLCFLPLKQPRVICITFKEKGVRENYLLLRNALHRKEQRPFFPHLTLARVKKPIDQSFFQQLKQQTIQPFSLHVSSLVLYESILTPLGPVYKVIKKWEWRKKVEK